MEKTIQVKGMHCNSCEFLITDALEEIGVQSTANHKTNIVKVKYDDKKVSMDSIKKAIEKAGYKVK